MARFPRAKQRDLSDCGAACLHAIARHYGLTIPLARIRQLASTDRDGTSVLGVVEAATHMGFTAKGVRGPSDSLVKIPKPAIAHVVVDGHIHHFVVITKVTATQVHVMDPSDGEIHRRSHAQFRDTWTGVLILLVPGGAFEPGRAGTTTLARFWALIRPHRAVLLEALAGAALYTLLGLAMAVYVQKLVDHVLIDGNRRLLNVMSLTMLVIIAFRIYLGTMKSLFILRTGQTIDAVLILGYYHHLLRLPQRFFDTMRVGEIISRIGDAVKIRAFINDVAVELFLALSVVTFTLAFMFAYSWRLGLLVSGAVPLFAILYAVTNRLNKRTQRTMMEHAAELESHFVESISGVATIKRFAIEEHAEFGTETRFIALLRSIYRSGTNALFTASTSDAISQTTVVLLLWFGSVLVIERGLTPGGLMSVYALAGQLSPPLLLLVRSNRALQDALIAADRLFEILDLEIESDGSTAELSDAGGNDIKFEGITFRYGSRPAVFCDLDLTIPARKVTAIVGESGCGKSTLIALLQRIYPLEAGAIRVGGMDLRYMSARSLRRAIAEVPQRIDLFNGSVLANIALGDPNPNVSRALLVAEQAGLGDLLDALPGGLDAHLAGNTCGLSAGEKQRLAIARALYVDPDVVLFDEATSALDSIAEARVQETVQSLTERGKTVVLIAHRLSTVARADKIVVLAEGRVAEEGTHLELFARGGRYRELWRYQHPDFAPGPPQHRAAS